MNFTWEGRQLKIAVANGKNIRYTYNNDGIRTGKTVDGVATKYFLDGSTILAQQTGSDVLWFLYESDGTRVGFTYNGADYYYTKNAQGDVTGIVDSNYDTVVQYSYGAWGKLLGTTGTLASTIVKVNPFLYRGYYYDAESGLYYLNSRYYDAQTGRFLNADSQINPSIGLVGTNLFAYSLNNPVNMADSLGHFPFLIVTAIVGAVIGAVVGGVIAANHGKNVWAGIAIGAAAGGLIGLGAGAAAGALLAGSATVSTAAVMTGGSALIATVSGGGLIAGGKMIADNVSQAVSKTPQVFWSGGNLAKDSARKVAQNIGGKTLEMTKLGQHLEKIEAPIEMWKAASTNFANVANNASSSIYSIQNTAGVGLRSIWATVEYPLLSSRDIIYGVASQNGIITIMP